MISIIKFAPYIASMLIGAGMAIGIVKFTQPKIEVKTEQVVAPQCPTCPPCNGIDYDKIKAKVFSPTIHQHLTINGDTTMLEAFRKIVKEEMQAANVVNCKR